MIKLCLHCIKPYSKSGTLVKLTAVKRAAKLSFFFLRPVARGTYGELPKPIFRINAFYGRGFEQPIGSELFQISIVYFLKRNY
jgi:hypothetical protein